MITVTKKPDDLVLAANQVPLEVMVTTGDGSRVVANGGVAAAYNLLRSAPPSELNFSLVWTTGDGSSYSVYFTVDPTPFDPDEQYLPAYSTGTYPDYWKQVTARVADHYLVAPWFKVELRSNSDGSLSIWAICRDQDPSWKVAWSPHPFFVVAGIQTYWGNVANDVLPITYPQYRVRCDVVLLQGNQSRVIGRIGSMPDSRSRVEWDLQKILYDAFLSQLEYPGIPPWGTALPQVPARILDYYLRLSELSDEDGFVGSTTVRGLQAYGGGISEVEAAKGNFFQRLTADSGWLTNRPDRRRIGIGEPVYLSFVNRFSGNRETYRPYVQLIEYRSDGSTEIRNVLDSPELGARGHQPITLPVGVSALGIDSDTLYYSVQVFQDKLFVGLQEITKPRTFIVDRTRYGTERYLAYLNGWMLPEVVRCTGVASQELDFEVAASRRVRSRSAGVAVPDVENWEAIISEAYTYRTGYLPRLEVETIIHEMARSPRLYEITTTGYTPLRFASKSFSLGTDQDNLHAATIKCELALTSRSYSRLDDLLEIPSPDYWTSPDGAEWLSENETPWSN